MRTVRQRLAGLFIGTVLSGTVLAQAPSPAAPTLAASQELRRYSAPEATQGVAVDARHFYAVANSRIAKYDKKTGLKLAEWQGDRRQVPHINSCAVLEGRLVCANRCFEQWFGTAHAPPRRTHTWHARC